MPLYVAFIDLTKAFDLIGRDAQRIGCPPKLQNVIESFHSNMKGTVQFNGGSSEPFDIRSGVKQGCVVVPTLFGIFFTLVLKHAFGSATEAIYLRTRSDGGLFNLARLKAKTKVREVLTRDMLFADDAAVASHTQQELHSLMNCFSQTCKLGLWTHHQSQEDECFGTGHRDTPTHYHRCNAAIFIPLSPITSP